MSAHTNRPPVETMSVSQARQHLSDSLNRVYRGEARILVEKSGIPVGAIVSPRDLEDIELLNAKRLRALEALKESQSAFADVPSNELEREVVNAVAEVKAEMKRERGVFRHAAARHG